jgi:hypothetical protein
MKMRLSFLSHFAFWASLPFKRFSQGTNEKENKTKERFKEEFGKETGKGSREEF